MMKKRKPRKGPTEEKTNVIGVGFLGTGTDSNVTVVHVKDGKLVRIRPLHYDWKYRPQDFNAWKFEARGKVFDPGLKTFIPPFSLAYKKRVYSPSRILYPLKRVDWDPNGERNPQNRGSSKFVRISWDEALDIIVSEIKKIKEKYGMYSILLQADGHGENKVVHGTHGAQKGLLTLLGGYTPQTRNPDSWEGWWWGAKHVWGMQPVGQMQPQNNIMLDVAQHTELLLFWGCDQETTPWGWSGQQASRLSYWFTDLGIKQIYICPDLNYAAAVHADKWIPIRPNTDAAMHLSIAYIWINEGTYDKEYVATHTYGFDKFEEYVMGNEDGVAKTPKWAEEITAVPARIIKALAREWASKRTSVVHGNGGPGIRGPYSTEPARLEALLLAMQGLGKPGANQVLMVEWGHFKDPEREAMPVAIVHPNLRHAARGDSPERPRGDLSISLPAKPKQFIPKNLIPDAILNPPISWYSTTIALEPPEDQFVKYQYPVEGCPEIHMVWTDSPSWVTCWNGGNRLVKAFRSPKIEFILAQHPWLENDCLLADLILPVNTKFEEADIQCDTFAGQYSTIWPQEKNIESLGESRSDYEIACMIAERFGLLQEFTEGKSVDDWIKTGFETSGVQDMISWDEFKEKGYYVIPTNPKWDEYPHGMIKFYEDPQNNPLNTPTGKIEFCATGLAKYFPYDDERPPVPHWIPYGETHQENLQHPRAKKYPLLLVSNHPRWSVHSQHEDITWLREIPTCKVRGPDGYQYHPAWINPRDAAERGIKDGDVVKVYNERGAILCGAYVTERIISGVVGIDHGAKWDPIVPGELDRGGAINTICPGNLTSRNATGMAVSGFLIEVERADLDEFVQKYPEAFQRPFHPAAGSSIKSFLKGDGVPVTTA